MLVSIISTRFIFYLDYDLGVCEYSCLLKHLWCEYFVWVYLVYVYRVMEQVLDIYTHGGV